MLHLLFALSVSFPSDKVLSLALDCMLMLLSCDVDFENLIYTIIYSMVLYNSELLGLFAHRMNSVALARETHLSEFERKLY
jgi:hypothetical protein